MVVPNLVFDALLFGLLIAAAALDSVFPGLHGVASLFIVGGATYWAAQELSDALLRRAGWTQESLATSVALVCGGFVYYWWRNQSDLALLVLSIGMMMSSLMVTISVIAAIGSAFREGQATPVVGWGATMLGSGILGVLAGVVVYVLGAPMEGGVLPLKLAAIAGALILWKWRERTNPPAANPHFQSLEAQKSVGVAPTLPPGRYALFPQRGTLLDRLLPILVLGVVMLVAAQRTMNGSVGPVAPAVAATESTPNP
jgi:hypothetical protein